MAGYKKILLVVDLSDDSAHIGARARAMAQRDNAALEILHVVEFVPVEPMGETLMPTVQIEAELVNRARQRITQLPRNSAPTMPRCISRPAASRPKLCAWRARSART